MRTFYVSDELHARVKLLAVSSARSMQKLVEELVEAGMGAVGAKGFSAPGQAEETIWGPVERVDPDGRRWIRATLLDDTVQVIEEEVLQAIAPGDVVWHPSIQMARDALAKAHASAMTTPPVAAPEPPPVPAAPETDLEDDAWMQDLDPTRGDDAPEAGRGERA